MSFRWTLECLISSCLISCFIKASQLQDQLLSISTSISPDGSHYLLRIAANWNFWTHDAYCVNPWYGKALLQNKWNWKRCVLQSQTECLLRIERHSLKCYIQMNVKKCSLKKNQVTYVFIAEIRTSLHFWF